MTKILSNHQKRMKNLGWNLLIFCALRKKEGHKCQLMPLVLFSTNVKQQCRKMEKNNGVVEWIEIGGDPSSFLCFRPSLTVKNFDANNKMKKSAIFLQSANLRMCKKEHLPDKLQVVPTAPLHQDKWVHLIYNGPRSFRQHCKTIKGMNKMVTIHARVFFMASYGPFWTFWADNSLK